MEFFSESQSELKKSNVVGFGILLFSENLPLTSKLREYVSPFILPCGKIETAFDFGFISKKEAPLGVHVVCHGHIVEDRINHFVFSLGRKPKSSPPANLVQASEKLGGYPTGFFQFLSILDGQQIQCRATINALVGEPKRWPLKIKRHNISKKVGAFTLEQEEIRLENKRDKTDVKITFRPEDKSNYMLVIDSKIDVKLDDACFENASEQLWNKAKSIFGKK
jgi:hypothetical protein